jgi:hypothetical protein
VSLDRAQVRSLASAKAKGKRPWFFDNAEAERVLNIAMALTQELAVTRERLHALERVLERKGLLAKSELDALTFTAAESAERAESQQDYLARVLRVMTQHSAAQGEAPEAAASIEELAQKI